MPPALGSEIFARFANPRFVPGVTGNRAILVQIPPASTDRFAALRREDVAYSEHLMVQPGLELVIVQVYFKRDGGQSKVNSMAGCPVSGQPP